MTDFIRIPLGPSGKPTGWSLIDLERYEHVISYRWYLSGRGYAFRTKDGRSVFLHREVVDFADTEDVDHINGDKLDNRRANLRPCTHQENALAGKLATVYPMVDQVRELRLDGWTNGAIASHLGISVASVSKYASDLPKADHPGKLWDRETIADAIRAFHAKHGRLPGQRDFNTTNGMPWYPTVYRFFDGMAEAREYAGFGAVDLRRRAA